ncbi:MAG: transcriptional regulator [Candidatus Marinimicrobia bacterium]|nr:transcriptional regulator [Candidatus Neomarinimicrobiota bacterium]|tara:strand:+ start:212 stop:583 length:372 start_codon:yes stop_codon:yes gene_type:complete
MKKNSWAKKELEEFKKNISLKRNQLSEELLEIKKRADEMLKSSTSNALYSSHMADASADHVEMEKAYYMLAREKKFLQCLDKALLMIKEGTFGICQSCNDLINKERLEEVPHTTKCFDCKTNR